MDKRPYHMHVLAMHACSIVRQETTRALIAGFVYNTVQQAEMVTDQVIILAARN